MKRWIHICLFLNFLACVAIGQFPFEDIATKAGLSSFKGAYGIAIGDFNNDRYEDISLTFIDAPPKVLINQKDGRYEDVTSSLNIDFTGNARTCLWIDIDNDGWLDLFIGGKSENSRLYQNIEGTTFADVTSEYQLSNNSNIFSINAAEVNDDPFLDIYLSNFLQENSLLINEGNPQLRNRVNYYRLWDDGKSMASIFFDHDNDGDDDLYLIHDGNQPNILYENIGNGEYLDVSKNSKSNIEAQGMGVDIGDINNDGCLDIYVTNLYENNLLLNNCDATYTDISVSAGVDDYGMGWGITFVDYNNDGLLDIFVCNDSYFSSFTNVLFRNNGDLTFSRENLSNIVSKTASYGCVCTDIDLDGRMDIFVSNQNEKDEIQLLYNKNQDAHNWIGFYMEGENCNRQAIGARIEFYDSEGRYHVDQVTGGNSYASQGSPLLHFGLRHASVQSVTIIWPDGIPQSVELTENNSYFYIRQGYEPVSFNQSTSTHRIEHGYTKLEVFPNPNTGTFTIQTNLNPGGPVILKLRDLNGRIIHQQEILLNGDIILSVKDKITGGYPFYVLELITEDKKLVKKIIIK